MSFLGGDQMRKIISLGIGMLALAGAMQPAAAADLAVKAPLYKAPPVIEIWSWSGFYVGLNGGYSWGRSRTDIGFFNTVTGAPIATPGSITSNSFNLNGGVFGGQAGYNWQSGSFVAGVETDIQWSGEKGSTNFFCAAAPGGGAFGACAPGLTFTPPGATGVNLSVEQKLQWFGTLRGRVGGLVTPSVLAYVTYGLAYGEVKTNATLGGFTANGTAVAAAFSHSVTKGGWTVGAGLEGRLGGNWTGKVEYLYVDLGSISGTVINTPALIGATYNSKITDNIFRVGVNYHFNAPVVARY
jgi:outer membrane immunogenic protein